MGQSRPRGYTTVGDSAIGADMGVRSLVTAINSCSLVQIKALKDRGIAAYLCERVL